ncbi:MAG: TonB family protein [Candidatus Zixiibacteriota bacterium]|jgi:TonB family protein
MVTDSNDTAGVPAAREVPRGVEVLIKKAAVDPAFKRLLFEKRAEAARAIGLELTPEEAAILAAAPLPQLEQIVSSTYVDPEARPAFLSNVGRLMLAALGGTLVLCQGNDFNATSPGGETENTAESSPKIAPIKTGVAERHGYAVSGGSGGMRSDRPRSGSVTASGLPTLKRSSVVVRPGSLGIRPETITTDEPTKRGPHRKPADRTRAGVIATVRKNFSSIQGAYDEAVSRNPSLAGGKVVTRFGVSPEGTVTYVVIVEDTLGDTYLRDAIIARIRTWRFAAAPDEGVTITYPFVFVAPGD